MSDLDKCPVCDAPADLICASCRETKYCSPAHRNDHWSTHKNSCAPFVIMKEKSGRIVCLRAHRDIEKGSIILAEPPMIHCPDSEISNLPNVHHSDIRLCVTCHVNSAAGECPKCKWPICAGDSECKKIHSESNGDCEMLFEFGSFYNKKKSVLEAIEGFLSTKLSALIHKDPEVFGELCSRVQHIKNEAVEKGREKECFRLFDLNEAEQQALLDIQKICLLVKTLGFHTANSPEIGPGDSHGIFFYSRASFLVQSCTPNCDWEIQTRPNFLIQIRAAKNIKEGQVLYISRMRQRSEQQSGTLIRQQFMLSRFGDFCSCKRCLDPTELNSFLSAVVCSDCRPAQLGQLGNGDGNFNSSSGEKMPKKSKSKSELDEKLKQDSGYFLPKNPGKSAGEPSDLWECNNCQKTVPFSTFCSRLNRLVLHVDSLMGRISERVKMEEELKKVIEENSGIFLHPNHFILRAAIRAFLCYSEIHPNPDFKYWQEVLKHIKFILNMDDKISGKGLSHERAVFTDMALNTLHKMVDLLEKVGDLRPLERNMLNKWISEQVDFAIEMGKETILYLEDLIPASKNDVFNLEKTKTSLKYWLNRKEEFAAGCKI